MKLPEFTIGIEEEYQIIDPESRELTSYIQEFLEQGRVVLRDQIKPEFIQSQVEVGSHICRNMKEVRHELVRLRRTVSDLAESNGLRIAAASSHPFSEWADQRVTAGERYAKLEKDMGQVALQMLIFGMHVHVGIEDRGLMIDIMNQARYFLPHLLALSTSSPFWQGRETGLMSYRSVIFESLPRTGLPPRFGSWVEFENTVNVLKQTRCIEDATKIWWDIRPHPRFPTLEFRVTDICTKVDEAVCLAALMLAIVAKLVKIRRSNQSWRNYPDHLITENKWRAVRYGIDGELIDFGKGQEVPLRFLVMELLDLLDDVVEELDIRDEVSYAHTILKEGTSADRQIRTFRRTQDLNAVVDQLVEETKEGWT
jgi:carboxylate-amine ligase